MPESDAQALSQAEAHFDRARQASEAGDFDAAIDAYLEGLAKVPNAVEKGHIPLRVLSLQRQRQGGAKPNEGEVNQRLSNGQSPLEKMLNAEYLLAKDPEQLAYAEAVLRAAAEGQYVGATKWIADLMFLANNNAKRPSSSVYRTLKESYEAVGLFERAISACQRASRLKPDDIALTADLQDLRDKLIAQKRPGAARSGGSASESGATVSESAQTTRVADTEGPSVVQDPESAVADVEDPALTTARAFFDKAKKAVETKNYDYAIELYLDGLRFAPEALEEGHLPLCEVGLQRRGKGGKKPSMVDRVKRLRGKTPLDQMLNAEYLFAKDPDHLPYAEAFLKAAVDGGYHQTGGWIANLIFQTNNAMEKPSLQTYLLLKRSYTAMGQFDKALAACQRAVRMKPDDKDLADEFKNLSAELTMATGKYDMEGDFRQSIRNRETQAKLYSQDRAIKTKDYRLSAVEDARAAYAKDPDSPKTIFDLADALADLGEEDAENEAIGLLEDTGQSQQDFRYFKRAGALRIKQIRHKLRGAKRRLAKQPDDAPTAATVRELTERLNTVELEHYRLCMENYPTDTSAKYEYAVRLMQNERYNEAIPLFQEAQKDPKRKISAMAKIGYCFFAKEWYTDAIEVFARAIDAYEVDDDATAKELRYNLARAHEEQGDKARALELFRRIAQLDFGFKDVSDRVDRLRAESKEDESGPPDS